MFGVIAAGRLVQTNFEQLSETRFVTSVTDAEKVNHVVVFMTGVSPFPDGLAGSVYFSWPGEHGPNWQLLGFISNDKPSAIFKIANLKQSQTSENPFSQSLFGGAGVAHQVAQVGISVEPLELVIQQTPAAITVASNLDSFSQASQRLLEHLYNFLSSFALTQAQMTPNPSESFVPVSALQNWYSNLTRRLQQDPNFLKS